MIEKKFQSQFEPPKVQCDIGMLQIRKFISYKNKAGKIHPTSILFPNINMDIILKSELIVSADKKDYHIEQIL